MQSKIDRVSRSTRSRGILAGVIGVIASLAPAPVMSYANTHTAGAARTVSLSENGNLRLTSRHGFTLNEQGRASGTAPATIYVHLKIVSTKRVTAEVNIYPKGGSISAYGSASYRRSGATGYFSGSLTIKRGTGSFSHANGSNLSFSGTIRRSDYAITVHVRGHVTD